SLTNIIAEIHSLYAGSGALADEPLQYADYAQWQSELLESKDGEAQAAREHWKRCSSIPPIALPFDRKPSTEFRPSSVAVPLPAELSGKLAKAGNPEGLLLASWQILLWRVTGQAELRIDYASDGRGQEELRSAIGLFAKSVPLYINFENDRSFGAVVGEVRDTLARAVEHQDYYDDAAEPGAGFCSRKLLVFSDHKVSFSVEEIRCDAERF